MIRIVIFSLFLLSFSLRHVKTIKCLMEVCNLSLCGCVFFQNSAAPDESIIKILFLHISHALNSLSVFKTEDYRCRGEAEKTLD